MAMTETTEARAMEIIPSEGERAFELAQREATALSKSELVPKNFQGRVADCLIAINLAKRIRVDALMVLQNLHIIHGRPSFSASFLISCFNSTGDFTRLQYRFEGEGEERTCVAYATEKESGELFEGPPVSMAMAKAEGWSTKTGSKWKTMPDIMMRYRAAAFFIRTTAPEIAMGLHTAEEMHDIQPNPPSGGTAKSAAEAIAAARDVTPPVEVEEPESDPIHDDEPPEDFDMDGAA